MSRIGLFGGTFAPFHKGHERALSAFLDRANLTRAVVMPSGTPPHKTKTALFTDRDRLEMTRAACGEGERITVSDWEICKEGRSYTWETLTHLKEEYPQDRLVLYVGSDMLLTLQEWKKPEVIFASAEIAAFSRTGDDLDRLKEHALRLERDYPGASITVYEEPPFPVSSTEIREKWERGEDISDLVPPAVAEELELVKYRIYLEQRLSPRRMAHSLGVMREAEILAKLHGADVRKARIAGLLHDMTKEVPREEHFRLFEKYGYPLDDNLKTNQNLWHAPSASLAVTEVFGITDPEIISAIRYHTTGKADMTLLENLLFMADLTDETRTYGDVAFYRALSRENPEIAALVAMRWCRDDVARRGFEVHRDMLEGIAFLEQKYPAVTEESEKRRLNFTE